MPRVFRKTYSRSVPADAQQTTTQHRKTKELIPAVRFKGTDGKWVVSALTAKGDRCLMTSPTWYGKVNGEVVPLCTNKAASEVMLADLVRKASQAKAGLHNPFEEQQ